MGAADLRKEGVRVSNRTRLGENGEEKNWTLFRSG